MDAETLNYRIDDLEQCEAFAGLLARSIQPGALITLSGDLGAGKTTFTRFLVQALGETGPVTSPTYTLVEPHQIDNDLIYHFDLYRLEDPAEVIDLDIEAYLEDAFLCIIEWPEQAGEYLPLVDLAITLSFTDAEEGRMFLITAETEKGRSMLKAIKRLD